MTPSMRRKSAETMLQVVTLPHSVDSRLSRRIPLSFWVTRALVPPLAAEVTPTERRQRAGSAVAPAPTVRNRPQSGAPPHLGGANGDDEWRSLQTMWRTAFCLSRSAPHGVTRQLIIEPSHPAQVKYGKGTNTFGPIWGIFNDGFDARRTGRPGRGAVLIWSV